MHTLGWDFIFIPCIRMVQVLFLIIFIPCIRMVEVLFFLWYIGFYTFNSLYANSKGFYIFRAKHLGILFNIRLRRSRDVFICFYICLTLIRFFYPSSDAWLFTNFILLELFIYALRALGFTLLRQPNGLGGASPHGYYIKYALTRSRELLFFLYMRQRRSGNSLFYQICALGAQGFYLFIQYALRALGNSFYLIYVKLDNDNNSWKNGHKIL